MRKIPEAIQVGEMIRNIIGALAFLAAIVFCMVQIGRGLRLSVRLRPLQPQLSAGPCLAPGLPDRVVVLHRQSALRRWRALRVSAYFFPDSHSPGPKGKSKLRAVRQRGAPARCLPSTPPSRIFHPMSSCTTEKMSRAALKLAGAKEEAGRFEVFVNGCRAAIAPGLHHLSARAADFSFSLDLVPPKKPRCTWRIGLEQQGRGTRGGELLLLDFPPGGGWKSRRWRAGKAGSRDRMDGPRIHERPAKSSICRLGLVRPAVLGWKRANGLSDARKKRRSTARYRAGHSWTGKESPPGFFPGTFASGVLGPGRVRIRGRSTRLYGCWRSVHSICE